MIIEVEFGTPAYDETVKLRDKLLRKPLGLEFTVEEMSMEYTQFHLAYYDKLGKLLGCMVLKPINKKTIQMRQVAVEDQVQKKGIGTKLVLASEIYVKEKGFKEMILHAREAAIPFYERLDYKSIGKEFIEVSIVHKKMKKFL